MYFKHDRDLVLASFPRSLARYMEKLGRARRHSLRRRRARLTAGGGRLPGEERADFVRSLRA